MELDIKQSLRQLERRLVVIYAIGLLILCCLSVFSTQVLKYQAADQVSTLIRRMIKLGDLRETVFTLGQANLDHFEEISYFNSSGQKMFSLPPSVELNPGRKLQLIDYLIHGKIENDLFLDGSRNEKLGSLHFAYSRVGLIPGAFGIWLLFVLGTLPLVINSRKQIVLKIEKDIQVKQQLMKAEIARKVRHDIRSPLFALQSVMAASQSLTGREKSVLHHASNRIIEIVKELEDRPSLSSGNISTVEDHSVYAVIENIYQEKLAITPKRIKFSLNITDSSFYGYTDMYTADLGRVLSNIIDNAIDSITADGQIRISLENAEGFNIITIADSGKGIPEGHMSKIWEKNFTFGKSHGDGIGLYYAKNTIETAGGSVEVTSTEGIGTQFKIKLPIKNQPSWIVTSIPASRFNSVVILDDQESVHAAWDLKVSRSNLGMKITHLYSSHDLDKWIRSNDSSNTLYLLDFDLKASENGLKLVAKHGLQDSTILVTGHFDDKVIKAECAKLGIKLLPKSLISSITVA